MKQVLRMTCGMLAMAAAVALPAWAQGGPGAGPGPGPGASAPRGGKMMMGPGGRYGADYTPGWALMTPEERNAHRDAMRAQKDYAECRKLMEQHHQQMAERAKARGQTLPAQPRHDACDGLKR